MKAITNNLSSSSSSKKNLHLTKPNEDFTHLKKMNSEKTPKFISINKIPLSQLINNKNNKNPLNFEINLTEPNKDKSPKKILNKKMYKSIFNHENNGESPREVKENNFEIGKEYKNIQFINPNNPNDTNIAEQEYGLKPKIKEFGITKNNSYFYDQEKLSKKFSDRNIAIKKFNLPKVLLDKERNLGLSLSERNIGNMKQKDYKYVENFYAKKKQNSSSDEETNEVLELKAQTDRPSQNGKHKTLKEKLQDLKEELRLSELNTQRNSYEMNVMNRQIEELKNNNKKLENIVTDITRKISDKTEIDVSINEKDKEIEKGKEDKKGNDNKLKTKMINSQKDIQSKYKQFQDSKKILIKLDNYSLYKGNNINHKSSKNFLPPILRRNKLESDNRVNLNKNVEKKIVTLRNEENNDYKDQKENGGKLSFPVEEYDSEYEDDIREQEIAKRKERIQKNLSRVKAIADLLLFYFIVRKITKDNALYKGHVSLKKFVFHYQQEDIENYTTSWFYNSIKIPILSIIKTSNLNFDISNVKSDYKMITDDQNRKYIKLEARLKAIMNNLFETLAKDSNHISNIIGFLHLITDEKSMIPLRFFPYFILARLNISENGQLINVNSKQQKMIIVWYLVCKVLVKQLFIDFNFELKEKLNETVLKSIVNFILSYIPVENKPDSLEYYLNLNKGYKYSKDITKVEKLKNKRIIDKLVKKGVDNAYVRSYSKVIYSDNYIKEKEENSNLFYLMSKYIEIDPNDSSYTEINELSDKLYKQSDLKFYYFCAAINNFNIMKLIWEYVGKIHKLVVLYSASTKSKEKILI